MKENASSTETSTAAGRDRKRETSAMNFTANKRVLYEAMQSVSRAVAPRTTLPILNNILLTFVWIIDMVMVGRLGPTAVAAVGVSGQMFNLIMAVSMAVTTGTIALAARFTGAAETEKANAVLGQSLVLGVLLSVFLIVPGFIGSQSLFRLFGAEASVIRVGAPYLRIVLAGTAFLVAALVSSSALRGAGDTRTPLIISVAANVVNMLLNYALIFGKFGMPRLEVVGAGIATVVAFFLEAAAFLVLFRKGTLILALSRKAFRLEREMAARLFRIGAPSAVEQGIVQIGFLWYMAVIARYGTNPLAAYMIGVNIMSLSFMPGFGFSVAASTTKSADAISWRLTLVLMRPSTASFSSGLILPLSTLRDRFLVIVAMPRATNSSLISFMMTSRPLIAATCAIPFPI